MCLRSLEHTASKTSSAFKSQMKEGFVMESALPIPMPRTELTKPMNTVTREVVSRKIPIQHQEEESTKRARPFIK